MKCLICKQAETFNGFETVRFETIEINLVVKKVPALICPNCGETYVEENIAARLIERAREMEKTGLQMDEYLFETDLT